MFEISIWYIRKESCNQSFGYAQDQWRCCSCSNVNRNIKMMLKSYWRMWHVSQPERISNSARHLDSTLSTWGDFTKHEGMSWGSIRTTKGYLQTKGFQTYKTSKWCWSIRIPSTSHEKLMSIILLPNQEHISDHHLYTTSCFDCT